MRLSVAIAGVLAAAALLGVCGCAVLGWAVVAFAPPKTVPPQYKIDPAAKCLVFVDDVHLDVVYEPIREHLTKDLNSRLLEHKVVAGVVEYDRLIDFISVTPDFNLMHVPTVGQKMNADVVLYVALKKFSIQDPTSNALQGELELEVKVVDSKTGRLWPRDRESYPLDPIQLPMTDDLSPAHSVELTRALAGRAAEVVAKLFYEHKEPRT